jgi:hypothetical protein
MSDDGYGTNWETFGLSSIGVVVPALLVMTAICVRMDGDIGETWQILMYLSGGLLSLYTMVEAVRAMRYDQGKAMVRRIAGIVAMALLAGAVFVLAVNSDGDNRIKDINFLLLDPTNSSNVVVVNHTSFAGTLTQGEDDEFAARLVDKKCGDIALSPSFLDFGVSGTRMSSGLFMIGFMIAGVASVTLIGENIDQGALANRDPRLVGFVTLLATIALIAFGLAAAILNWLRLPERPDYLGYTHTRSHNIYDSRQLIVGMLIGFLGFLVIHDFITAFSRKDNRELTFLTRIVYFISWASTILALAGAIMMMTNPEKEDLAERIVQLGVSSSGGSVMPPASSMVNWFQNMTRDVPPAVMVCTQPGFDDYKTASFLLSFVAPSALLHAWRAIYSTGIMVPNDTSYAVG